LSRGLTRLIYARDTESLPDSHGRQRKVFQHKPAGRRYRRRKRFWWRGKELVRNMADSREVMNIRQASDYLGVSPDTLYKYVGEEKIPAFKLGNRWRFKKSKLDQWMEEKSSQLEPGIGKQKAAMKAAGTQ
jgi:excisionase family DNA binding protein